ncbi:MAG: NTP transferase domain-containing protein [Chlorobi bacterium]|nr:NTP transferase domain-containing protein [Chlorobiota bacterium]
MKNILQNIPGLLENNRHIVLATILETKGSAPQVPGASAVFSNGKLLAGTLGGGSLEGNAARNAGKAGREHTSMIYTADLNASITSEEGAICGGHASLLLDADPGSNKDAFVRLNESLLHGNPGVLVTIITGRNKITVERFWVTPGVPLEPPVQHLLKDFVEEIHSCFQGKECRRIIISDTKTVFLEPVGPLPKLVIAGAGHIGKALSHMAGLLDFEITVIDDRPEYASRQNLPDADTVIVDSIGHAIRQIPITRDTFIVIVTRGHRDDADALKACIHEDVAYIGMIGSKRKIALMRDRFITQQWASATLFDRVFAPVGLNIGAQTVNEIALSICAQLIRVRDSLNNRRKRLHITSVVLAAGESKRMGKPKLMLPFDEKSIIETVVSEAVKSAINSTIVVLGSDAESIGNLLRQFPVETVYNRHYKTGMFSSVQCGLRLVRETTDAVMILLGDQPMIGTPVMNRMTETFKQSGKGIVVATYRGKRGHPVLIRKKYFTEILGSAENGKLKDLLKRHPEDIEEMEYDSSVILRDIDTENDYLEELKYHKNHE